MSGNIKMDEISSAAELLSLIYTVIGTQILIPLGSFIKKKLTKDPIKDVIKKIEKDISKIKNDLELNSQSGALDDVSVIKVYNSHLRLLMLRLLSLYHERTRLNHIRTERHRVLKRYELASQDISSKFFTELESFTCRSNKKKLSGFLNNSGGEIFVREISTELFLLQEAISLENQEKIVSIKDIEDSFERYVSIISSKVKKWIDNDTLTLDAVWDDIEDKISFYTIPADIEIL